jgi:transcriptional regulator with XRE-family HTH domain
LNNIGSKIKDLRKSEGYTQKELAEILKKDRSTIANYETNTKIPPLETLLNICQIFKVPSTYFTDDNQIKPIIKVPKTFTDFENALNYLSKHKSIDLDLSQLTKNEIISFANEIQELINLLNYKYKELIRNKYNGELHSPNP